MGGRLVVFIAWWLVDLDTLRLHNCSDLDLLSVSSYLDYTQQTYPMLESSKVGRAQRIGLGYNGDEVHS